MSLIFPPEPPICFSRYKLPLRTNGSPSVSVVKCVGPSCSWLGRMVIKSLYPHDSQRHFRTLMRRLIIVVSLSRQCTMARSSLYAGRMSRKISQRCNFSVQTVRLGLEEASILSRPQGHLFGRMEIRHLLIPPILPVLSSNIRIMETSI